MSENDAALLSWLAGNDAACPVCSYNLRGLKEPRCPECASELHLAVGSSHFLTGPWVLGLVSFALAMGFDGVVLVIMTVMGTIGMIADGLPPRGVFLVLGTVYGGFVTVAAACGCGVWLLVKRRKAWLAQTPRRQWQVAITIFLTVGVLHLLFGGAVMLLMSRL